MLFFQTAIAEAREQYEMNNQDTQVVCFCMCCCLQAAWMASVSLDVGVDAMGWGTDRNGTLASRRRVGGLNR